MDEGCHAKWWKQIKIIFTLRTVVMLLRNSTVLSLCPKLTIYHEHYTNSSSLLSLAREKILNSVAKDWRRQEMHNNWRFNIKFFSHLPSWAISKKSTLYLPARIWQSSKPSNQCGLCLVTFFKKKSDTQLGFSASYVETNLNELNGYLVLLGRVLFMA